MRNRYIIRTALFVIPAMLTTAISARCDDRVFTPEQLKLPGKRGACQTRRVPGSVQGGTWEVNLPKLAKLQPYWNYSWGAEWIPQQKDFISSEFMPMIWGTSKNTSVTLEEKAGNLKKAFAEKIAPCIKDGTVKRVMGFNEPDKEDQSGIPYMEAIELWPLFIELGVPLVSPTCANPEGINDPSTQGVPGTWMRDFMREADKRGYRVDYIGVHWYGGSHAESFKVKLRRVYEMYGQRPLLITEFAPAEWNTKGDFTKNKHTPAKVLAFAKEILPWMAQQDWIAGYNWFSFSIQSPQGYTSALFFDDGSLTALGRYYASITTENPAGDQSIEPDDAAEYIARAQAAQKKREGK